MNGYGKARFFFILWGLLISTCVFSSALDAQGFSQKLVARVLNAKIAACESALTELNYQALAEALVFASSKSRLEMLPFPEDRLAFDLAASPKDPVLEIVSEVSTSQLTQDLFRNLGLEDLVLKLGSGSHFASDASFQAIVKQSDSSVGRILKARDLKQWAVAIAEYQSLETSLKSLEFLRQIYVFALMGRAQADDLDEAEKYLKKMILEDNLKNGENYGLLGSLYKRKMANLNEDAPERSTYLNLAIEAYENGFISEPSNYYPGVNAVTLRIKRGDLASEAESSSTMSLIASLDVSLRHTLLKSRLTDNFWFYATRLQLLILRKDWQEVYRQLESIYKLEYATWQMETTLQSIKEIHRAWGDTLKFEHLSVGQFHYEKLNELMGKIEEEIKSRNQVLLKGVKKVESQSKIIVSGLREDTLLNNQRINLDEECRLSGICAQLGRLKDSSQGVVNAHDFLKMDTDQTGYLLGLTQDYNRPVYESWADVFSLEKWWEAYARLGLNGDHSGDIERFMEKITSEQKRVVFLVPRNIHFSNIRTSHTAKEFEWLAENPVARSSNVLFVLGAQSIFSENFVRDLMSRKTTDKVNLDLKSLLKAYRRRLLIQDGKLGL
ncbi:MAG: DUF4071 domain-containing protein [Proteobacteria bacterium]|nr:DUF4071 domain-containing protein [Pseudomonadota bacterium]